LQHPNEYIRGVTLRFLCRIREEEILEPLIPSILACLEHRHSYVRRNAVLAINALYKLPKGELLLQDAPELIEKVRFPATRSLSLCLMIYSVMHAVKGHLLTC
jgi:coatomer subunit beta